MVFIAGHILTPSNTGSRFSMRYIFIRKYKPGFAPAYVAELRFKMLIITLEATFTV
jgi:hypothetical protein